MVAAFSDISAPKLRLYFCFQRLTGHTSPRFFALKNAFYIALPMTYRERSFLRQYSMRGRYGTLTIEAGQKGGPLPGGADAVIGDVTAFGQRRRSQAV